MQSGGDAHHHGQVPGADVLGTTNCVMKLPDQKFRAAKTSARRLEQSLIFANSASVSLWDKVVHVVAGICSLRRSACIQGGRDLGEVNGATRALHEAHLGSHGSEP